MLRQPPQPSIFTRFEDRFSECLLHGPGGATTFTHTSSGTNMTGRPVDHTKEMNGGSTASYLACTPSRPLFMLIFIGLEAMGLLDFQGRHGIASAVQWNLRPVIFGVDKHRACDTRSSAPRERPQEPTQKLPTKAPGRVPTRVPRTSAFPTFSP